MKLSPKQKEFWNAPFHRWNVKHGATRTGKTYLDYFMIPRRIRERTGQDGLILLLGNTKGTLQRNVIEPMQNIYGESVVTSIRSDNTATIFGEKVHCLGADNKKHVDRLRGTSVKYCYGDEVVSWEREVFEMLKSRLDKPYSCFDGTCNPAQPDHWFKEFIDGGGDIFAQHYALDDNPFLPAKVAESMKQEHGGVFYQRNIMGLWVRAEGIVYPMFDQDTHVVNASEYRFSRYIISIDYGTMNPFSAGLWGFAGGLWVRMREYYHDGRKTNRQRTDEEYLEEIWKLADGLPIERVVIDPSAASFIAALKRKGGYIVKKADNPVIDGIRNTAAALKTRKILIDASCKDCINEFHAYSWNEKSEEDRPIKENDHAMDDVRYFVQTVVVQPKARTGGKPSGW